MSDTESDKPKFQEKRKLEVPSDVECEKKEEENPKKKQKKELSDDEKKDLFDRYLEYIDGAYIVVKRDVLQKYVDEDLDERYEEARGEDHWWEIVVGADGDMEDIHPLFIRRVIFGAIRKWHKDGGLSKTTLTELGAKFDDEVCKDYYKKMIVK